MRFDGGCAAYAADQAQAMLLLDFRHGNGGGGARAVALSACAQQGGASCIVRA